MRAKLRKAAGRMRNVQMAATFAGWARYTRHVKQSTKSNQMEDVQVRDSAKAPPGQMQPDGHTV
jgi:hypothetical protein